MKRTVSRQVHRVVNHGNTLLIPRPFAGKYPTRIRWTVGAGNREYHYVGKPNRIAIQKFLKCVTRTQGFNPIITFVEVDQRNILCQLSTDGRRFEAARSSFYSGWNAYHPFTNGTKGWEWLMQPWWRIKINNLPVYSPIEKPDAKIHLLPYTRWFSSIGWLNPREGW